MLVAQYEIGLPADYDMGIVEERVRTRGHATDGFPDLGLKAYAVRRRGRHGSPVNAYAPFYLWERPEGLTTFLAGPFRAIVQDFGRPVVRHWIGVGLTRGPARGAPVLAVRRTGTVPHGAEPAVLDAAARAPRDPALLVEAVALDPARWELVRFSVFDAPPTGGTPVDDAATTVFEVLHASAPRLAALPAGVLSRPLCTY
ncbi:DUF4865 family protein [Kineococcus sp. SYSU DK006]|uniref:DUF4865 family protein n=1 Tax=Kineococcus sp. SYSU DK006 TaxID=3383127 RepID=UPI003D7C8BB5